MKVRSKLGWVSAPSSNRVHIHDWNRLRDTTGLY